jgi:F-type H+-transporting ATPase subunit b
MDIQITQILFQAINFSVVLGALVYLLYKPVLKIFDERAQKIAEGQQAAEAAIKEKDELEQTRKKMESDLKKERANVLKTTQEEAKQQAQEIVAQAKKESKEERSKLVDAWQKEKAALMKESKQDMADAVIAVSAKVMGKALDIKAQQKLIDNELDSILKSL